MGKPIPQPGDLGVECTICNGSLIPYLATPRFVTAKFSGLVSCPDLIPLPERTLILTQFEEAPCWWFHDGPSIFAAVNLEEPNVCIAEMRIKGAERYRLFIGGTEGCVSTLPAYWDECDCDLAAINGTCQVNFNPEWSGLEVPDMNSLPFYLAKICGFDPTPDAVYDYLQSVNQPVCLVIGNTKTGKGSLFSIDLNSFA